MHSCIPHPVLHVGIRLPAQYPSACNQVSGSQPSILPGLCTTRLSSIKESHHISNGLGVCSLLCINCSKSCARKSCGRVHRLWGTGRSGKYGARIGAVLWSYVAMAVDHRVRGLSVCLTFSCYCRPLFVSFCQCLVVFFFFWLLSINNCVAFSFS